MVFICDNVDFHKNESIKTLNVEAGQFIYFFACIFAVLDPYKEAFSLLKEIIRAADAIIH